MVKSPLAQAFGIALSEYRIRLKRSSEEIAKTIETTVTYYKAVEAGTHNLHVSKSFLLCRAFEGNGSGLNLPSVLHLLGFISMLELACSKASLRSQAEFADIYYQNFIEFTKGSTDLRMKVIREKFEAAGIFELLKDNSSKEIKNVIEKYKLDNEVFALIDRPAAKNENLETNLHDYFSYDFFSDFPTFYIGHIIDVKRSLKRLPIKYDYKSSIIWERENEDKIVRVFGICSDKEFLVSKLAFRKYDYNYLWGDAFRDLKFIILNSEDDGNSIKSQLKEELVKCLNSQISESISRDNNVNKSLPDNSKSLEKRLSSIDAKLQKVHLTVANGSLFNLENLLTKPTHKVKFNTFWIFELEGRYYFGVKAFIPTKMWRFQDAEYLSFGEAEALVGKFDALWKSIK